MCKGYMTTCCAIWLRFNSLLLHFAINPSFYRRKVLIELLIRCQEASNSYLKSQPEDVILLHFQLLVQSEQLLKEVGQQRVAGALVVVVVGVVGLLVHHLPLHRVVWGVRLCAAVLRFFKMTNFVTLLDYKMFNFVIVRDLKMRNGTFCHRLFSTESIFITRAQFATKTLQSLFLSREIFLVAREGW